jgi:histidine triad (HIT) family protein
VASVEELAGLDGALSAHLLNVCVKVAQAKGVSTSGYRIVTNVGAHGGQTVLHVHFHVLGGRPMTWPPG